MAIRTVCACVLAAMPLPALAGEAPESTRPTPEGIEQLRIDTAHVLDAGEIEVEGVFSFLRHDDHDTAAAVAELEYGVVDRFMLELEVPFRMVEPAPGRRERGLGDIELEGKLGLYEGHVVAFAASTELECPTGDEHRGLGSGNWELAMAAQSSVFFALPALALHTELGAEWEEGEGIEQGFLNLALEYYVVDDVALQLGLNGEAGEDDPVISLVPGFQFEMDRASRAEVEIGIGFPIGVTDTAQVSGVILDVEIEL
jgi:hypothetical protein